MIAPAQRLPTSSTRVVEVGTDARRAAARPGRSALGLRKRWFHPRAELSEGHGARAFAASGSAPEQGPVSDRSAGPVRAPCCTISFGTPRPSGGSAAPCCRREHGRQHPAVGVDRGAARVAAQHLAAKRGHPAPHRAAAVGVLADHLAGASDARRRDRERPVLRDSRAPRRRCPSAPGRERQRRRFQARDAQERQIVARLVVDGRRVEVSPVAGSPVVSSWPATTWALVTTRPGPATHPEPSIPSPQAVPRT